MHFTPDHEHTHEAQDTGGLDARAKIVAFLGVALGAVSLPRGQWALLGAFALILAALMFALRVPLLRVARRMLAVSPFFLLVAVFLPFRPVDFAHGDRALGPFGVSEQGLWFFLDVVAKAALSIGCVTALGTVESVPGVARGMQRMRVPAILVTLVMFTHRYVFVLLDEARRMKRARDARAFGARWLWQATTIGHMVGALFLRSIERAERVHYAMLSRGYEGGSMRLAPKSLRAGEWLMIAACLAVIVAVRFMPL